LQICKSLFSKSGIIAAICLIGFNAFAQTTAPEAPVAPVAPIAPISPEANAGGMQPVQPVTLSPSVTMPSLPRVSAPVSGGTFYTPGKRYLNQSQQDGQKQNQSVQEKSASASELEKTLFQNIDGSFSNLSAQDLVQMAKSGSITNVSSLLGNNFFNRGTSGDNFDNQILLKKILSELSEIKKAQNTNNVSNTSKTKPSILPPKILRFVINANDVLSKCVQVYFSDTENDGSFLLTGDERTLFENENVSETFYLLFKANGTKNSKTVYSVTPTLSQSKQTNTLLSKFCSAKDLTASRVGNLVTLHMMQDGMICDLLLDIGKSQ